MPYTNPFFKNIEGVHTEHNMYDDLVREQIKMFGYDATYMPRDHVNLDKLLHESTKSVFEFGMPIPAFIKNFSGYNTGIELLTKFGVRASDDITLVISRSEFSAYYAPFIKSYYQDKLGYDHTEIVEAEDGIGLTEYRPKEGDLIYFPFDDGIFEIKYVMFDQPFFQFGVGMVYELQCEKFEYSGEVLITDYIDIDDNMAFNEFPKVRFFVSFGIETFEFNEQVDIYKVSDIQNPDVGLPELNLENFRMFNESGFLKDVPSVVGRVMEWHKPKKELVIGDMSEYDPHQRWNDTKDGDREKMDNVLIVGRSSGAMWRTNYAEAHENVNDDAKVIQDEFQQVGIVDDLDDNPFGFI